MTENENEKCFDGLLTSDDIRTGFISGETFQAKAVQYSAVDELAIFEGCIVLGTVEEMEAQATAIHDGVSEGVFRVGEKYRWPDGIVPYQIHSNLPNLRRVLDAINHWQEKTSIRFVERTSSNESKYPNYLYFISANGCWSYVGMQGGKQNVGLARGCRTGSTIHEIGHALGLWHEQSREDRDRYIRIHFENILSDNLHNFDQHISDGDDYGPYDYDSIMHYPKTAFSKNGKPTITSVRQGKNFGQRNSLSAGDIATIEYLYSGNSIEGTVIIYEHANYQGATLKLGKGNYDLDDLGNFGNDRLSSLKVPVGMKITLYEHAGFKGRTKTFSHDTSYVGDDFNDHTSSIKIEDSRTPIKGTVIIYEHANYRGATLKLGKGNYDLDDLGNFGNDRLSSLKVPVGMKITLYEHAGFKGRTKTFSHDTSYVGDDFNDHTSSIKIV